MKEIKLIVEDSEARKRLDLFLITSDILKEMGVSRTALQKLILSGMVTLNGKASKAHQLVKSGDLILVRLEERAPLEINPEEIPLEIVYQDVDLAVINKPAGLVVHPGAGNTRHTLVNALAYHLKQLSQINPLRPGIVHRLDKDTSGLMVVAKNDKTHLVLAEQFAQHSIKRQYTALVKGKMEFDENEIELPLGRHPKNWKKVAVTFGEEGKYAKTHYRTLKRTPEASLVELNPFTGRTHQLRVHLAYIGHPILGDCKYGKDNPFQRLALHANYLGFIHPSSEKFKEFSSALPAEFLEWMRKHK